MDIQQLAINRTMDIQQLAINRTMDIQLAINGTMDIPQLAINRTMDIQQLAINRSLPLIATLFLKLKVKRGPEFNVSAHDMGWQDYKIAVSK